MRKIQITWQVILGAIGVAIGLCVGLMLLFMAFRPANAPVTSAQVEFTVIPAPSLTPTLPAGEGLQTTPTPSEGAMVGGIAVGMYVQISGTGGDGLRLRIGPGTTNDPVFLGMEAEVFQVVEGPKIADGFTWWFLQAPYDNGRKGWAASKYLTVVANPPK